MSMHHSVVAIDVFVDDEHGVSLSIDDPEVDAEQPVSIAIPIAQVPWVIEQLEKGYRECRRLARECETD